MWCGDVLLCSCDDVSDDGGGDDDAGDEDVSIAAGVPVTLCKSCVADWMQILLLLLNVLVMVFLYHDDVGMNRT